MGLSVRVPLLTATRLNHVLTHMLDCPRSNTSTLFAALTHGPASTAHAVLAHRPPCARCPRRRPCTRSTSSTARTRSLRRTHAAATTLRVLPREHPHPRPRLCPRPLDSTASAMPFRALPALSPPRNERPRPQTLTSDADTAAVPPPRTVYARLHATACIEPDSRQRRHARAPRTTRNERWETRCTTQATSQRSRRIALSALCDCY
ncbi:hypothetical protein B0H15DRAFT_864011 [Mycena belliarum]|uniref:Uncharacterized protein n=1 Tax=Mycena belliarum TaxID=1033014 RepID=A0AAD6XJZ8_9AGAR|nr:hypothetical protein B0H15DRAFT_863975 [Mycena belliae]KAJ7076477.1 hypothetical protein B0H15DRAFT_864011 [Mycena belliae]